MSPSPGSGPWDWLFSVKTFTSVKCCSFSDLWGCWILFQQTASQPTVPVFGLWNSIQTPVRKPPWWDSDYFHKAKLQFRDSNTFLIPTQSPPKGGMRVLIQSVPLIHLSPFPLPEQVNYHQSIDTDDVQSTPAEQKSAGIWRKLAISCSAKINCDFSRLFTPLASCKLTFLFPWICLLEEFSLAPRVPQIERSASVKRVCSRQLRCLYFSLVFICCSERKRSNWRFSWKKKKKTCTTESAGLSFLRRVQYITTISVINYWYSMRRLVWCNTL